MNNLIEQTKQQVIKQMNKVAYFFVSVSHEVMQYVFSKSGSFAKTLKAKRTALAKKIK